MAISSMTHHAMAVAAAVCLVTLLFAQANAQGVPLAAPTTLPPASAPGVPSANTPFTSPPAPPTVTPALAPLALPPPGPFGNGASTMAPGVSILLMSVAAYLLY